MDTYRNKKILFISRTLRGGGAERFISTFTSYLVDNGYNVELLLYEKTDDDYQVSNKLVVCSMPQREVSIKGKIQRIVDMERYIRLINPDIIIPFIDTVVSCSYIANLATGKKFVYTVRVSPWHEGLTSSKLSDFMRKIIARHADAIMLQNLEQADYYPENYKKREYIVPNPIPSRYIRISKTKYKNDYTTLVMSGRLDKQKNILLAIEAVAEIYADFPNLKLHIYGEGVEKENIIKSIKEKKLDNICIIEGRTNNIESILQEADLYLMTSNYEGMPNALMEAMAIGVPCISSDCKTGPKDLIVDGKTGLLFKTSDKADLVKKMIWSLMNTNIMNEMGKEGRNFIISNFQLKSILDKFEVMINGMEK